MLREVTGVAVSLLERPLDEALYLLALWASRDVIPGTVDQMWAERFVSAMPAAGNARHLYADLTERRVDPNDETHDAP